MEKAANIIQNFKGSNNEYECPICYLLITRPSITPCKHLYCKNCIETVLDNELKCPLCRSDLINFVPKIDEALFLKISKAFPKEYEAREKDYELTLSKIIKKKFIYGNSCAQVDDLLGGSNTNKWKLFFRTEENEHVDKYIKKLIIELHPTFKPKTIEFTKGPFELVRLGWGTFNIPIKIYWKDHLNKEVTEIEHYLSFEDDVKATKFTVEFNRKDIEA